MDERDLLGEEDDALVTQMLTQEEEDALLDDINEPTSSASTAANQLNKDEELLLTEDLDCNGGRLEEDGEAPESLVNYSAVEENTESSESSATPTSTTDAYHDSYVRSIFRLEKRNMLKTEARFKEKFNNQRSKVTELHDNQRSNSRQLIDMRKVQDANAATLNKLLKIFSSLAASGIPPKGELPVQGGLVSNALSLAAAATAATNNQKRKLPPAHPPSKPKRVSDQPPGMQPHTSALQHMQPTQKRRRSSIPSGCAIAGQILAGVSTPCTVRLLQAVPPIAPNTCMPERLPRPGPHQAPLQYAPAKNNTPAHRGYANGHYAQEALGQSGQHKLHTLPRPAPYPAPTNGNYAQQQRKTDKTVQRTSNGCLASHIQPSSTASSYSIAQTLALAAQKMMREHSLDQNPAVGSYRQLVDGDTKVALFARMMSAKNNTETAARVDQMYRQTVSVDIMAKELDTIAPRNMIVNLHEVRPFNVPAATDKRKIMVEIGKFKKELPGMRPSIVIPVTGQWAKENKKAPTIEIKMTYDEFMLTGKINGRIRFTPPSDWPENTARICVFYFIGTQNTGQWCMSEFATVEAVKDRETSVKFVISLEDKHDYFQGNTSIIPDPIVKKELIGMVPFACAGSKETHEKYIRGNEVLFDADREETRKKRFAVENFVRQFDEFVKVHRAEYEKHMAAIELEKRQSKPTGNDDDIQAL